MPASSPPLVITGATGLVGRRLLQQLASLPPGVAHPASITLLVRRRTSLPAGHSLPSPCRVEEWDLGSMTPLPTGCIPKGSVILHLAAATGRARPAEMRAVNVTGTAELLAAAEAAGAAHFILVSSIAAGFPDQRWYPYADSKRAAEALVEAAAMPTTIVRPTTVFGPGSSVQAGLEGLAKSPLPLMPGTGQVRVQPIAAADLAGFLLRLAGSPPGGGQVLEVGGAETVTMHQLVAAIRSARGLPARTVRGVPLGLVRRVLAILDPVLGTVLPVSAGQLCAFVNDSVAAPHPLVERLLTRPAGVAALLEQGPSAARTPDEGEVEAEFRALASYLGVSHPSGRAIAAYRSGYPAAAAADGDRVDARLVRMARRSTTGCALAESYARLVRPHGGLRRRLVLALAVLESGATTHSAFDTARPSSALAAWAALVGEGIAWMALTVTACILIGPRHAWDRWRDRRGVAAHG